MQALNDHVLLQKRETMENSKNSIVVVEEEYQKPVIVS
jgi:hypothetical protein